MPVTDRVFLPVVRFERTAASFERAIEFFVFGNEETCGILVPIGPLLEADVATERQTLCELLDEEFVEEFAEIIGVYLEYLEETGYIRHDDEDYLGEVEQEDGDVRCELLRLSGVAAGNPGTIAFDGEYYFIASADTEFEDFFPLVTVVGALN